MTVSLCPVATIFQYFNDVGVILAGGKVNTYLAGTTTPQVTYTDVTGVTPNSNPIILASNGRLPNVSIWQPSGVAIKIIITDANNNQIGPVFDNLTGINDAIASTGTFVATLSGMTAVTTFVANYFISNNNVSVSPAGKNTDKTGTSNTTSLALSGMPALITPVGILPTVFCANIIDNNTLKSGIGNVVAGQILFNLGFDGATNFTASSVKGLSKNWFITYPLN